MYLLPDLSSLDSDFFNLSMTYKANSDFPLPYGRLVQALHHPRDSAGLTRLAMEFGEANRHLAVKEDGTSGSLVTQFVSHCFTHSQREAVVVV